MRRFLALFLSLFIALSGSVAFAADTSEPNRMGGFASIYQWITAQNPGGGGGTSGGGAQRFSSKSEYDAYVGSMLPAVTVER